MHMYTQLYFVYMYTLLNGLLMKNLFFFRHLSGTACVRMPVWSAMARRSARADGLCITNLPVPAAIDLKQPYVYTESAKQEQSFMKPHDWKKRDSTSSEKRRKKLTRQDRPVWWSSNSSNHVKNDDDDVFAARARKSIAQKGRLPLVLCARMRAHSFRMRTFLLQRSMRPHNAAGCHCFMETPLPLPLLPYYLFRKLLRFAIQFHDSLESSISL